MREICAMTSREQIFAIFRDLKWIIAVSLVISVALYLPDQVRELYRISAADTGWMTEEQLAEFARRNPQGRVGQPEDCASLVAFLCSTEGAWVNGQLLHSNGGLR